ncbi:MAG: hypothetical protein A3K68_07445 [Euryarchaeota archaeon RBG_16_68_13]|nr:MAG: hypothetical protein A3K68_07445 [Euryarchaeota archaeon RBG_16_68_13]
MASTKVTFEVPEELRELMGRYPEVNWSAVFRDAIVRQSRAIEAARGILVEEEDRRIRELSRQLKRGTAERFRRAQHARRG